MIRPSLLCGLGDLIETGGPEDRFCAGSLAGNRRSHGVSTRERASDASPTPHAPHVSH